MSDGDAHVQNRLLGVLEMYFGYGYKDGIVLYLVAHTREIGRRSFDVHLHGLELLHQLRGRSSFALFVIFSRAQDGFEILGESFVGERHAFSGVWGFVAR